MNCQKELFLMDFISDIRSLKIITDLQKIVIKDQVTIDCIVSLKICFPGTFGFRGLLGLRSIEA